VSLQFYEKFRLIDGFHIRLFYRNHRSLSLLTSAFDMKLPVLVQRIAPATVVTLALLLVATGFAIMAAFTSSFGPVAIITGMTILGLGVATIVTLGTDLILSAAPPEKAGAASAISETGADLGGSFGVAVLGSVGGAVYRTTVAIPDGLSRDSAAAVRDTLGAAVDVANALPSPSGSVLLASAQQAFEHGLVFASAAGFCVLLSTAVFFPGPTYAAVPCARQFKAKEKSDDQ
jgi:MFS transporter, DHA2 family, multidrug resistance protein